MLKTTIVALIVSVAIPSMSLEAENTTDAAAPDKDVTAWVDTAPPAFGLLQTGVFLDSQTGVISGKMTWITTDGGKTWNEACEQGFWQIAFADNEVGFASGGQWGGTPGIVYKTEDGGRTWREVFKGGAGLMSIAVGDRQHAVAGSPWRADSVWVTGDGGATWSERRGAGADIHAITAAGPLEFYAINLAGRLSHTTDGGVTWKTLATLDKRAHSGQIALMGGGKILAALGDHGLFRSDDGGRSFTIVQGAPPSCGAIRRGSDGRLMLAGDNHIWESSDAGENWTPTFETSLAIKDFCHTPDAWWVFGGSQGGVGFWPVSLVMRNGATADTADSAWRGISLELCLKKGGFVSIIIEDADGVRIRNLLADQPRSKGTHTESWDCRDEFGEVVKPGVYRWRGIFHEGLHATYEFSFNSPASPPWRNKEGTGGWGSDHSNPQAVAAVGGKVFIGWPFSESGRRVIAVDTISGRKLWEQCHRLILKNHYGGQATALAADDQFVYVALQTKEGGIGFCRLGIENGTEAEFVRKENGKDIREIDHVCDPSPAAPSEQPSWSTIAREKRWDASTAPASLRGCAADTSRLFTSSYWGDVIYVNDKRTGADLKRINVPRPAGLAVAMDGSLIAISGNEVVKISVESGAVTATLAKGLTAPMGLAALKDGGFLVSERGPAMRVRRFDAAGAPAASIGIEGGRPPTGPYNPNGMLLPWGIAVDNADRIWVAEEDFVPRRVSVWRPDGPLDREFVGSSTYAATGAAVNPDLPTMAIDNGTIFKLDWTKGAYTAVYSMPRMGTAKGAVFGWPFPGSGGTPHAKSRFLTCEGRQFLLLGGCPMTVYELVNGEWKARSALGSYAGAFHDAWRGQPQLDLTPLPGYDPKTWKTDAWPLPKTFVDKAFIWCDHNGDGLVQGGEIESGPVTPGKWFGLEMNFDDKLTAVLGDHAIPRSGWTECGAPLYRMADLKPGVRPAPADKPNGWNTWKTTPKGWLIASGYHGSPHSWVGQAPSGLMAGYSPDGSRKWVYRSWFQTHGSMKAPSARRGLFVGDWYFGGVVDMGGDLGEVFHLTGNLGQHFLFTADGIQIGALFRDARTGPVTPSEAVRGMSLDNITNATEGWLAGFFRNAEDKQIYALSCASKATCPVISKVTGLEMATRLAGGNVEVSAVSVAMAAERNPDSTNGAPPRIVMTRAQKPPDIDGDLAGWDMAHGAGIPVDEARGAKAALSYDANNLYAAFVVRDPYPLRNNGTDPLLLFKTGTVVDVSLGTDKNAPKGRSAPAAGDLRLLFAAMGDKPIAVLYRPVCPGATDKNSFSSPNCRVEFDSVRVLSDARVAFKRSETGFTIEAAVPLKAIGWKPEPGSLIKGDVGVIYSDDIGKSNILRSYWSNKSTNLTADVGEESRLQPREWSVILVEK